MIERLEKLDQITQEYHLEKAAGFFLAQVQRRRYIKALWKKRDEEEVQRLGITNTSGFNFIPSSPESNHRLMLKNNKKKRAPPGKQDMKRHANVIGTNLMNSAKHCHQ
jgi:hypothetical protein